MFLDNDGRHIASILERTTCKKHGAQEGAPCWNVRTGSANWSGFLAAICGARVKRAGFNGKVDPSSLRLKNKATQVRKQK